jgi:hypothetical protein
MGELDRISAFLINELYLYCTHAQSSRIAIFNLIGSNGTVRARKNKMAGQKFSWASNCFLSIFPVQLQHTRGGGGMRSFRVERQTHTHTHKSTRALTNTLGIFPPLLFLRHMRA